ncbi:hypothetical protein CR513_57778, partial [Mucuna pruriens]
MVNEISAIDNLRLENQLIELTSPHPTDMCPTLQETKSNHPKIIGLKGGYQCGKQSYQSRAYDSQQFGRQQYWLNSIQGQYPAQKFRFAQGAPQSQNSYQPNPRYHASPFPQ